MDASLAAQLARIAYCSQHEARQRCAQRRFPHFDWLEAGDTQGYVAANDVDAVIVFRGTEPTAIGDWLADLDARKVPAAVGRVHRGFRDALLPVASRVLQFALERSHYAGRRLHLIGHSLGGALATITAGCLVARPHEIVVDSLVTFGAPRAGDKQFADWLTERLGDRCYRFERCCDLVPRLPRFTFAPVDGTYYFDRHGQPYFFGNTRWLFRLCDRIAARCKHIGRLPTLGIAHHSMDGYLDVVRTTEKRCQLWVA